MKKPRDRAIYICERRWDVEFIDGPIISDGETNHGLTKTNTQVIRVTTHDTCDDAIRSTLLHEILHAIQKTVGNGHKSDEEDCVQVCETGLYSLLRDKRNEWALELIWGDE